MPFKIKFERTGLIPGATKREVQKIKAGALYMMADSWDTHKAKGKFSVKASRKYHYGKRKTKDIFNGRILKFYKDMTSPNPLVWTGQTRNQVTSGRVNSNSARGWVSYSMPTLNRKPKDFERGQMSKEFKRVLPSEEDELAKVAEAHMRSQFNRHKKNIEVTRV